MDAAADVRWQRLKDIFGEALELAPESRAEFLSVLRFNDKTLYEELAELLDSEESAEDFLQKPISLNSEHSFIGETIGHYRITSEIGRGGMGAVFEAAREDGEFDQKVAVKITNRGFFSDELIRRFRKERQILAKLEHPNIVRLLDGGITFDKTPFYVMEHIEGSSITEYCESNQLSVEEKLNLFLQICDAVAYAHRQLIVHRDLKPSNILVTNSNQAKLLDFGIAKILDVETELQTQTQNAPLTPEYASPEQIKGETITTASDIYSLGTILYELLTGKAPTQIYGVGKIELVHSICEIEPPRPSYSNRKLKGDLDNIILKCLRKKKENRYKSTEQLIDDIKSYLNGMPVKAHPQSFAYRAQKFVLRNRLIVAVSALMIVMIVGGSGLAVWQYWNAEHQRQIAEHNFNQVRKIANSWILDYHDQIAKLEGSTQLRERLVSDALNYLDGISQNETDDPELLKEMAVAYRKIGNVQGMPYASNLGKTDEAIKNYQKSADLLGKALLIAPKDLSLKDEQVKTYNEMAQVMTRTGVNSRNIFEKAIKISDELNEIDGDNLERRIYSLRLKMFATGSFGSPDDFEGEGTIESYKKVADEAALLREKYPENISLIAISANTNERIGNMYRGLGNKLEISEPAKAQEAYKKAVGFSKLALEYVNLRVSLEPNDANNLRRVFSANTNMAAVMGYLNRLKEAEHYQKISEEMVKELRRRDIDNKETVLDEVAAYKNKINILEKQQKFVPATRITKKALEFLENYCKSDPLNAEGASWQGMFYYRLIVLLEKQKLEKNAQTYRVIFEKFKQEFRRKFSIEDDFYNDGGR